MDLLYYFFEAKRFHVDSSLFIFFVALSPRLAGFVVTPSARRFCSTTKRTKITKQSAWAGKVQGTRERRIMEHRTFRFSVFGFTMYTCLSSRSSCRGGERSIVAKRKMAARRCGRSAMLTELPCTGGSKTKTSLKPLGAAWP